jgi:hypothetical protein
MVTRTRCRANFTGRRLEQRSYHMPMLDTCHVGLEVYFAAPWLLLSSVFKHSI